MVKVIARRALYTMPSQMSVELIPESQVERRNKYLEYPEWQRIQEIMQKGIPKGQALKIILSDQTIQDFKGKDKKKAALLGFRQKLNKEFNPDKTLRIQVRNDVITIVHKKEKK
jgi:hypothetical protein